MWTKRNAERGKRQGRGFHWRRERGVVLKGSDFRCTARSIVEKSDVPTKTCNIRRASSDCFRRKLLKFSFRAQVSTRIKTKAEGPKLILYYIVLYDLFPSKWCPINSGKTSLLTSFLLLEASPGSCWSCRLVSRRWFGTGSKWKYKKGPGRNLTCERLVSKPVTNICTSKHTPASKSIWLQGVGVVVRDSKEC